ncbi:hypothetical protein K0U27_00665 [archaeon]|nr:hypothetical protein [archaeon]
MQYFASFQNFEIFDEFNGVDGTYIKSFLISDVVNLNDWQATHEANISNIDSFIGRPGIHYTNPENGKLDHTSANSFEKSLQIQELYRAANIIAVGCDIPTKKCWQVSKMMDDKVTEKIRSKEIKWISPSIWPEENSVEQIEHTDGRTIDVVHDYKGLHYAFVDEPAYSTDAEIKSFCDGNTKQCQLELAQFNASIDNVKSITENEIKLPAKEKKEKNSSAVPPNTSDNSEPPNQENMSNEEELRKELEDAKKALKAKDEELEKEKEAKKATQEEENEKKNSEGKKAETEEDEEKKELKARVAVLEKEPIVEKIVSAQLSAGIISQDKVSETTSALMASSKDTLDVLLNTSKSFQAKLKSISPQAAEVTTVPYMGSVSDDSYGGSFDASVDDMDMKTLMEKYSQ